MAALSGQLWPLRSLFSLFISHGQSNKNLTISLMDMKREDRVKLSNLTVVNIIMKTKLYCIDWLSNV